MDTTNALPHISEPISVIFDGTNYDSWAQEMCSFLKGCLLWRYVTGEAICPTKLQDETEENFQERLDKFDGESHQILTWFQNTCHPKVQFEFCRFKTVKEVWDFLKLKYSIADDVLQFQLYRRLCRMHQRPGQTIHSYVAELQSLWDQLASFDPDWPSNAAAEIYANLRDRQRIWHLLMTVRDEFQSATSVILHRGTLPTLDVVIKDLIYEEIRINNFHVDRSPMDVVCATTSPLQVFRMGSYSESPQLLTSVAATTSEGNSVIATPKFSLRDLQTPFRQLPPDFGISNPVLSVTPGDALNQEAKLLPGVRNQVQSLQRELERMKSYLKDAEAKQEEGDERLRSQITEIRRIAYAAEDVIDLSIPEAPARERESLLKWYASCSNCLVPTDEIGAQIGAIKARLHESKEMLERYQVGLTTEKVQRRRPQSYPHINDECVVGLDNDIKTLAERLTNIKNKENVLCIVGMGGSGKTTLARKLYNNAKIKQHFRRQAWVSISQEWNSQYVLFEILRQVTGEERRSNEILSMEVIVEKLTFHLMQKWYLIVLDDVWKKEALEEILPAFPYGKGASKIIITTRYHEISRFSNLRCFIHESRSLTESEAWKLFSTIALNHRHKAYDYQHFGDFEKLGKDMLRKCDGLPLAVVALGGLLGAKDTIEEWEKVSKAVSTRVMESRGTFEYGMVKDMLALSYRELPYELKPCFLYLALFPEDCEIPARMLIRMWVSEGFVTSQQLSAKETLEDVARQSLEELIQRCVVQVAIRNHAGKLKAVRIHDLMRDLCIKRAKEQDFLQILSFESSFPVNRSTLDEDGSRVQSRRNIVHFYARMNIPYQAENSPLRSLFLFGQANVGIYGYHTGEARVKMDLESVCLSYRLLKILNLVAVDTYDGRLPANIGGLIHLRYLGIRCTNIVGLPESIGNLQNLLTLDYRGIEDFQNKVSVPNVLWKIECLRHLFLPYDRTTMEDLELHKLQKLQTLWGVGGGNWMLKEMSTLSPSIERLNIQGISRREQLEAVSQCPSLISDHLQSLYLDWGDDGKVVEQNLHMISHCTHLRELGLRGVLRDGNSVIHFPNNLQKLDLLFTKLESQDTMTALGTLPNLKDLNLSRASYMGREWTCREGAFPQLEQLNFLDLPNLEEWTIESGSMCRLKKLTIWQCMMLKQLPEGLKVIDQLQELEIRYMSESFNSRLRQADHNEGGSKGGEDLHKIQRIPIVRFD